MQKKRPQLKDFVHDDVDLGNGTVLSIGKKYRLPSWEPRTYMVVLNFGFDKFIALTFPQGAIDWNKPGALQKFDASTEDIYDIYLNWQPV